MNGLTRDFHREPMSKALVPISFLQQVVWFAHLMGEPETTVKIEVSDKVQLTVFLMPNCKKVAIFDVDDEAWLNLDLAAQMVRMEIEHLIQISLDDEKAKTNEHEGT